MSVLYLDNNLRMKNSKTKHDRPNKEIRQRWSNSPTVPKTQSNLVKSSKLPSFSTTTKFDSMNSEVLIYDRQKLLEFLNERESNLFKTRDEYEEQFENFFSLAKRFHTEKLNNLKLTFKNQILKQQIYFETELLELSKECMRDYECSGDSKSVNNRRMYSSKKQSKHDKYEKEKHIVKLFKSDMKKLLDYMREALINSSDTLIEAYETCHVLKALENIENNFQKQNSQMKLTTSNLTRNSENSSLDDQSRYGELKNNADDSELTELNKQLSEEQELFNNYKEEMDDLMHTLDDIELQHLQRKDQLTTKTKFFNKLKNKFKFIETKYDKLNKNIADLKYESYIFKKLWLEKQHCSSNIMHSNDNDSSENSDNNISSDNNLECNLYTKQSSVLSSLSTTLSASSSSRSSSTSSLSDCVGDTISSTNEINPSSESSSKSSSSSASSNQDISELMTGDSENLDFEEELVNEHNVFECCDNTKINDCDDFPNLSLADYNRKLVLINELINLQKSKMSAKDLWSMSSETEIAPSTLNNFIKANIKYFNLKDEEEKSYFIKREASSICYKQLDELSSSMEKNLVLFNIKQESSLNLADVSTDGDRVCIENCNLKADHNVSDWFITRQIDEMSISSYKFPRGSIISSGKCLRVEEPFLNDQLSYLLAIKNQQSRKMDYHTSDLKKSFLKIRTKLLAPDGTLKAIHTQEIPQFYQEIFKYANLIKFL